jgi:hypothetical protein
MDGSINFTGAVDIDSTLLVNGAADLDSTLNVDGASTLVGNVTVTGGLLKLAGSSGNDAAVGGVLYGSVAAVGNVGAGEDDLMTYTVPANTLSADGMGLHFEAWGTFANNGNTKTVKVLFGADSYTIFTFSTAVAAQWKIVGRIVRTGAATQDVFVDGKNSNTTTDVLTITTATRTLSGSNVLKLTGTGTSNNDIVQEYFRVWWEDANT